jgi:predicted permease
MAQDILFAIRLLRRHPALFGITVAGLAVAIGITTAALSVAKSVAFAGYGASASESVHRVVLTSGTFKKITGNSPFRGQWTFDDYSRLGELSSTMTLVGWASDGAEYRGSSNDGAPQDVRYLAVSGNYFTVLGMRASAGRLLSPADDTPGSSSVVVSQGFWKNRLGADPAIVGRTIWLGNRSYTIVGVVDRKHTTPSMFGRPPALWMSLAAHRDAWSGRTSAGIDDLRVRLAARRGDTGSEAIAQDRYDAIEAELVAPPRAWNPAVEVLGRLNTGITRAQAEAEIGALALSLANATGVTRRPIVHLEAIDQNRTDAKTAAAILLIIVGLVLFVACANVTNVLLASAASRRREIGTRLAIGASRGRILRQLLTESVLLGSISSFVGLGIAMAVLPSFAALIQVPPAFDVSPDLGIYASLGAMTVVVGILAGLAPARYGQGQDLTTALKVDQAGAPLPLPKARLRSLLIATQAAVSAVLLVLAGLLARSLIETSRLAVDYDVNPFMTLNVGNPTTGSAWGSARRDAYWTGFLEQVRQIPGVASAALAVAPPFSGTTTAPQRINDRILDRNEVSPDYFHTVGISLVRGRTFTPEEVRTEAPVAIISASLAREVWGSENPLGASLDRVWGPATADDAKLPGLYRKPKDARVIGVVGNVTARLGRQPFPAVYLPISQTSVPRLVVRAQREPGPLVQPLRDVLQSFDPRLQPTAIFARDELRRQLEVPQTLAVLSLAVGLVALGLAVIGLFGVTAFVVEQRTHELSVRRALGAGHLELMTMLLRESLRPVFVGLLCGLFVSVAGGRVLQSLLYGVSPRDPVAFVGAVGVLVVAASAAVLVPARRAARINPAQLLKLA